MGTRPRPRQAAAAAAGGDGAREARTGPRLTRTRCDTPATARLRRVCRADPSHVARPCFGFQGSITFPALQLSCWDLRVTCGRRKVSRCCLGTTQCVCVYPSTFHVSVCPSYIATKVVCALGHSNQCSHYACNKHTLRHNMLMADLMADLPDSERRG
jgi:hypothetical protein